MPGGFLYLFSFRDKAFDFIEVEANSRKRVWSQDDSLVECDLLPWFLNGMPLAVCRGWVVVGRAVLIGLVCPVYFRMFDIHGVLTLMSSLPHNSVPNIPEDFLMAPWSRYPPLWSA